MCNRLYCIARTFSWPAGRKGCDDVERVLYCDRNITQGAKVARARRTFARDEPLPEPIVHSEGFRQTRAARRGALVEDYVELIADLIEDGNEARQVDIAARLGVAQPTVAK